MLSALARLSERLGRERARRYLLGCSDRTLADAGFSRERLERGEHAWPWRLAETVPASPGAMRAARMSPAGEAAPAPAADRSRPEARRAA